MPVEKKLLMNVMHKASSDALHTLLLISTLASVTGQASAEPGSGEISEHASATLYGSSSDQIRPASIGPGRESYPKKLEVAADRTKVVVVTHSDQQRW